MDADVTPDFDLGFIVNNESRADPDNEVMSRTNDVGLVSPPQVPPELIPLLDVSFDENLSEIMDEFDQNSSSVEHNHQTVASENTVANLNPNAQFLNLNLTEVESFLSNQENANTVKKTLRDVNLVRKFLKMKNENRDIHEIPCLELDQYLATFVLSVRKTDGHEYEPSSLRSIISSIDRKLGRQKYGHKLWIVKMMLSA